MSNILDGIYEVDSPEATRKLACELAEQLNSGDVIALIGDLGVGKTAFTKGIAEGLDITEDIVSPTFTIICEHTDGKIPLYHMDVYRIEDEDELFEIGFDDYIYGDGVTIIEWADLIPESMPEQYTRILIEKDLEKGVNHRKITITNVNK